MEILIKEGAKEIVVKNKNFTERRKCTEPQTRTEAHLLVQPNYENFYA
jgi:hypothetical protein